MRCARTGWALSYRGGTFPIDSPIVLNSLSRRWSLVLARQNRTEPFPRCKD